MNFKNIVWFIKAIIIIIIIIMMMMMMMMIMIIIIKSTFIEKIKLEF